MLAKSIVRRLRFGWTTGRGLHRTGVIARDHPPLALPLDFPPFCEANRIWGRILAWFTEGRHGENAHLLQTPVGHSYSQTQFPLSRFHRYSDQVKFYFLVHWPDRAVFEISIEFVGTWEPELLAVSAVNRTKGTPSWVIQRWLLTRHFKRR